MHPEAGPVDAVVRSLRAHLGEAPPIAIVLGSGLGGLVSRVTVRASVGTDTLQLPQSTVSGHAGKLVIGRLGDADVAILSGRIHGYEGYTPAETVRYVRALHRWGVRRLLLTASVGGISEGLVPGALMVVTDHINWQGKSPLTGPQWGPVRFPDMGKAYDPTMRAALHESAREHGITLRDGVYVATLGPSYETPAEVRAARVVGGDVVGMSTVPEVLAAVEAGLPVAALAVVSNLAAGLSDAVLTHEEVTEIASRVGTQVADLIGGMVARLSAH
jgi:purine-nucleoside phosphorylase